MTKIEKWAHIAEIVSAIAIVMSLIYVGYQVRVNTITLRNGTQQSLLALGHDWDGWLVDRDFADVIARGNDDYSLLSSAEKLQYGKYVGTGLNVWEYAFYSFRDGMMKEDFWRAWNASFRSKFHAATWQLIWRSVHQSYGEEFQRHVSSYTSSE